MDIHAAATEFKLVNNTVRVRSTGEVGDFWGCDTVPPTRVTLVVQRLGERTLADFDVEDVELRG
jgi:hypothetical protein